MFFGKDRRRSAAAAGVGIRLIRHLSRSNVLYWFVIVWEKRGAVYALAIECFMYMRSHLTLRLIYMRSLLLHCTYGDWEGKFSLLFYRWLFCTCVNVMQGVINKLPRDIFDL